MSKFIEMGACWKNKGEGYTCKISEDIPKDSHLQLLKNKYKQKDGQPDLKLGVFEDDNTDNKPKDKEDLPF